MRPVLNLFSSHRDDNRAIWELVYELIRILGDTQNPWHPDELRLCMRDGHWVSHPVTIALPADVGVLNAMVRRTAEIRARCQAKIEALTAPPLALVPVSEPEEPEPETPAARPDPGTTSHSRDFRECEWYGKSYKFSPKQSQAVRRLWAAWEEEEGPVSAVDLLHAAESDGDRVRRLVQATPGLGRDVGAGG